MGPYVKRKTNVPKKIFLATNISEVLSNQIPVKYKDPGCPTISCTIGQTEINRAFDLGASINYSLSQYIYVYYNKLPGREYIYLLLYVGVNQFLFNRIVHTGQDVRAVAPAKPAHHVDCNVRTRGGFFCLTDADPDHARIGDCQSGNSR